MFLFTDVKIFRMSSRVKDNFDDDMLTTDVLLNIHFFLRLL